MRRQTAVNTNIALAVLACGIGGCAPKDKDPLDELKMLIPKVEEGLNSRDLAALQKIGTEKFASNSLVIDVFGDRVRDSVRLTLSRIQQTGTDATLILNVIPYDPAGEKRELRLRLQGGEKWRIDSYEVIDTLNPGA